jgi:RimJ/RimL family protein N-acetyltransferase
MPDVDLACEPVEWTRGDAPAAWRQGLPVLHGASVALRDLRSPDAASLCELLATEEVLQFIPPTPRTVSGFENFVQGAIRGREAGEYAYFAVVPNGLASAVGVFQLRRLALTFDTTEWGFAIGSPFWGSGLFLESARLVIDFAFGHLGVHRLEARSCVENGRGNGALRKIGATREVTLRGAFRRGGLCHEQSLWSILAEDWLSTQNALHVSKRARF